MFGLIVPWLFLVSGLVASKAVQMEDTQSRSVPIATTHRSCFVCAGPLAICESLFKSVTCPVDKQFCINELTNRADASRKVVRRCGTQQECHDSWLNGTSSSGKCANFDQIFVYTSQFTCDYCCTSDNCNLQVNPTDQFNPALG
ncbi:uncharacterized protein LOC128212847 [Mya arenaria]|nr:uncharacterized protein LOC128212847 [Mya arenaria]